MKRKNIAKKAFAVVLSISLSLPLSACGDNSSSDTSMAPQPTEFTTVRFGTTTGLTDHYLAVIGTEKGFFEEHGINLQINEFASGINTVDAVISNTVDIGKVADYAIVNRIGNTQSEFNAKLIGRFETAATYSLYVSPNEVSSLDDLAGKTIITMPGTIIDYFNALTLQLAGIHEDDVEKAEADSAANAVSILSRGDAVAFWASGITAEKLQELGMKELINMNDISSVVDDYYVASNNYLEEHKTAIEGFFQAIKETQEWLIANEEESAEIISDKLGIEKEQVIANIDATNMLLDFSQETVNHLQDIESFTSANGYFEGEYNVTDYIDTTILKAAIPDADVYQ